MCMNCWRMGLDVSEHQRMGRLQITYKITLKKEENTVDAFEFELDAQIHYSD